MVRSTIYAALLAPILAYATASDAVSQVFSSVTELAPPVAPGATGPSLATLPDGRIAMSWMEPTSAGMAVRMAIAGADGWGDPATVVATPDLFVNHADTPSIAALPDGRLAVHWLRTSPGSLYSYDVQLALSQDDGRSWTPTLMPHRDRSPVQHGFVSLEPRGDGRLMVVWLDGRAYSSGVTGPRAEAFDNAMQLRATSVSAEGTLAEDEGLDIRTCSCCQTAATTTEDGTILVAYRDRTAEEVRDISLVRFVDGAWTEPATVHQDGWVISGCPVNGPALDANGGQTVIAWFTAADDIPSVRVAFSRDAGVSFTEPVEVDRGNAIGHVDVLHLGDGSALLSWVEWIDRAELLFVCRVRPGSGCDDPQVMTRNEGPGSIDFPRMARSADGVHIAWTHPRDGAAAGIGRGDTIRVLRATLPTSE